MANDPTILDQSRQDDLNLIREQKCAAHITELSKGHIVYKRDSGLAHRIARISFANGIQHYNLICSETNSSYFLSKFALESHYTEDSVKVEHFGLKMVRRLSKMWGK
jgi:hypothetical protein